MLDQEIKVYNANIAEWLKTQSGKFVLIKGDEVIGFYNTLDAAISDGARQFGLESFLVREVVSKRDEINIPALSMGILNANTTRSVRR